MSSAVACHARLSSGRADGSKSAAGSPVAVAVVLAVVSASVQSACGEDRARTTSSPLQVEQFTNSVGMRFQLVLPGSFLMGSPEDEDDGPYHNRIEESQHEVTLTQPFYMSIHEVTRRQYAEFLKTVHGDRSRPLAWDAIEWHRMLARAGDVPVTDVSWNEAVAFCVWLTQKERRRYRLPTEAEWEYVCRAGATTRFCCGDHPEQLDDYAWTKRNSGGMLHAAGRKRANAWGFHDMHGNVWEMCQDFWAPYPKNSVIDPTGPQRGAGRVIRGGYMNVGSGSVRCAIRRYTKEADAAWICGFRVVSEVQETEGVRKSKPASTQQHTDEPM